MLTLGKNEKAFLCTLARLDRVALPMARSFAGLHFLGTCFNGTAHETLVPAWSWLRFLFTLAHNEVLVSNRQDAGIYVAINSILRERNNAKVLQNLRSGIGRLSGEDKAL